MRKTVNVIALIALIYSSCEKEKQIAPETHPLIMQGECSGCGGDWDLKY